MIRGDILEELAYLEEIAISLGKLKIKAQSLPLTVDDVMSWKQELDTLVLSTDQLDLHDTLLAGENAIRTPTPETCRQYLDHYTRLINQMRRHLYELKTINRKESSNRSEVVIGSYIIFPEGLLMFRGNAITFGGKLRAILIAFLMNNDHTLEAGRIAEIWGDDNTSTVSRHKCKLEDALAPYYGDRRKHITSVRTNPVTYQLDID